MSEQTDAAAIQLRRAKALGSPMATVEALTASVNHLLSAVEALERKAAAAPHLWDGS